MKWYSTSTSRRLHAVMVAIKVHGGAFVSALRQELIPDAVGTRKR